MSLLEESLQKDRIIQYTSAGIHKDDLIFEIDGFIKHLKRDQVGCDSVLFALH